MSHKKAWYRGVASAVCMLGIAAIPLGGCGDVADVVEGCDKDFTAAANWGANLDIDNRVVTFMGAAGALVTLSDAMVKDVTDACVGIAVATKRDAAKWETLEGADRLKAVCAEAELGFDAVIAANSMIALAVNVEGGGCEASLSASAECNARCDVTGMCTPAQLEAKCTPGQLAGSCSAACTGSCRADVGATVQCNGACSATCNGTCAGTWSNADGTGRCDGVCNGTCSGTCDVQAGATVQCGGTCRGECSVAFEAPHCEGKLTPPECNVDADCEASCRAQVQAEAVCTPPKVSIDVVAGAPQDLMDLIGALEVHLPKLIQNLGVRGEATIDAANTLVTVGDNLGDAITSSGKAFVCTTLAASAAATASVEVKVSVEASVNIGGKAAGSVK